MLRHIRFSPRFVALCAAVLIASTAARLSAQDAPATDNAATRFKSVNAEWEQLNKQLEETAKKFQSAPADARAPLIEQYNGLVDKATKLVPKLREAAVAAYKDSPNTDQAVTQTVIGMASAYVKQDQYEDAKKLTDLLLKNDAQEPAVHTFAGEAAYCLDDFATAEKHLKIASDKQAITRSAQQYLTDLPTAKEAWEQEKDIRAAEAKANDLPRVTMETSKGKLVIELYENEAPQAVGNFVSLVESGFYNGLTFHRVLGNFMAQGGCPEGTGTGGPGYKIYCECQQENHRKHFRGTLSMAHAGPNTGGSQFFLTFKRTAHLDGRHTVFGRVIEGLDVLEKLQRRSPGAANAPAPDRIIKAEVTRKRDHVYAPKKVG